MVHSEQLLKYMALDDWFKTPHGLRVARAFSAELMKFSDVLIGDKLIQIGLCGDSPWLTSLRFRHKWLASPYSDDNATFVTLFNHLPVDKNSIDCVVAPLMLEAFTHDKNPIDEIDRVLKSTGYVVFFGINPLSFWGATVRYSHRSCFGQARGTLTTSLILKHAMLERGYQQCALSSFYYIPPGIPNYLIQGFEFLNVMGKMIWPFPPGFYCLIFQKYQSCSSSWLQDLVNEPFLLRRTLQATQQSIHE